MMKRSNSKKTYRKTLAVLTILSFMVGLQLATQYFAWAFRYQATLGFNVNHIYPFWDFIIWAIKWGDKYPLEIHKGMSIWVVTTSTLMIGLFIVKVIISNSSKGDGSLHGSARWGEKEDIIRAGLLPKDLPIIKKYLGIKAKPIDGVYVGAWKDKNRVIHYLKYGGGQHVLTVAPTGSGKGVGLVNPTLLSWEHSAVISDLKGELWQATAGWRKHHANNVILKFEPASPDSIGWNVFNEIRFEQAEEIGDVQNVATLIVDPDGKGLNDHWQKTSYSLIVGLIVHIYYKSKAENFTPSLPYLDQILSDPNTGDIKNLWTEMSIYGHVDGEPHTVASSAGKDMLDRPDEEAGSVLSTAKSFLSLYRDPIVAKNVSFSSFKITQLMHHDKPVSLYLVTKPADKSRLKPLIRLILNMIIRLLADKIGFENGRAVALYKHRLLMMLDEFPSLGKLEILQESLAFLRGYGIMCYLITQDMNQLKSNENGYGQNETISANCHVLNAYQPNILETAEYLSKLTGIATIVKEQVTVSGKRAGMIQGQVSKTYQEVQRPLMTADECLRMRGVEKNDKGDIVAGGEMLISVTGFPVIRGEQILYFKDPVFSARASIPAPEKSDCLIDNENEKIKVYL